MSPLRNGKALSDVPAGHRRRLSDARNAWRKMTPAQRRTFADWQAAEALPIAPPAEVL
jgi:hypothetical protein